MVCEEFLDLEESFFFVWLLFENAFFWGMNGMRGQRLVSMEGGLSEIYLTNYSGTNDFTTLKIDKGWAYASKQLQVQSNVHDVDIGNHQLR